MLWAQPIGGLLKGENGIIPPILIAGRPYEFTSRGAKSIRKNYPVRLRRGSLLLDRNYEDDKVSIIREPFNRRSYSETLNTARGFSGLI